MGPVEKTEKKRYTKEEYFALEEKALEKHDYHHGEIIQRPSTSINHNIICVNLILIFGEILKEERQYVFGSDIKIDIPEANHIVYPDFCSVKGEIKPSILTDHAIVNPHLIVEVVCHVTEAFDRGEKFQSYQKINSLQTYILVSENRKSLECYSRKSKDIWSVRFFDNEADFVQILPGQEKFRLSEIYEGIL
jgi:Uma2 family endonuclease